MKLIVSNYSLEEHGHANTCLKTIISLVARQRPTVTSHYTNVPQSNANNVHMYDKEYWQIQREMNEATCSLTDPHSTCQYIYFTRHVPLLAYSHYSTRITLVSPFEHYLVELAMPHPFHPVIKLQPNQI